MRFPGALISQELIILQLLSPVHCPNGMVIPFVWSLTKDLTYCNGVLGQTTRNFSLKIWFRSCIGNQIWKASEGGVRCIPLKRASKMLWTASCHSRPRRKFPSESIKRRTGSKDKGVLKDRTALTESKSLRQKLLLRRLPGRIRNDLFFFSFSSAKSREILAYEILREFGNLHKLRIPIRLLDVSRDTCALSESYARHVEDDCSFFDLLEPPRCNCTLRGGGNNSVNTASVSLQVRLRSPPAKLYLLPGPARSETRVVQVPGSSSGRLHSRSALEWLGTAISGSDRLD